MRQAGSVLIALTFGASLGLRFPSYFAMAIGNLQRGQQHKRGAAWWGLAAGRVGPVAEPPLGRARAAALGPSK